MKTNENQSNAISLPEINNLQELTEGCSTALITYGLNDKKKLVKMVVLFDAHDIDFESVNRGVKSTMIWSGNMIASKSNLYSFRRGILKCSAKFFVCLYKDVFGFAPNDSEVHDCREGCNDYWKGGYYG